VRNVRQSEADGRFYLNYIPAPELDGLGRIECETTVAFGSNEALIYYKYMVEARERAAYLERHSQALSDIISKMRTLRGAWHNLMTALLWKLRGW